MPFLGDYLVEEGQTGGWGKWWHHVDPLVEELSLLGTRFISGKTKMRRGRLRAGSWQPSRETCVQTLLMKVPLNSACREAGSREAKFTELWRIALFSWRNQETRGEKGLVGGGNSTAQLTHLEEGVFGQEFKRRMLLTYPALSPSARVSAQLHFLHPQSLTSPCPSGDGDKSETNCVRVSPTTVVPNLWSEVGKEFLKEKRGE